MDKEKLKCPDFGAEVALLIQDFVYSKEDIEFSFVEENLSQANLFSLYAENECISAVLLDQHEKEFMYLGYMSTLGKWRRKGIGKTLMKLIIRLCFMMTKELKDIYLISRNIQDENGKWYTVKESPVYRFWESLGFYRIPWSQFPSIPTVLEQGTILTQARAYRFEMNENNYVNYVKDKTIEQSIEQLRTQTKVQNIHLKVFSPNLHSETMKWPPMPKHITDKEASLVKRFQRQPIPQMPPSYFQQRCMGSSMDNVSPLMMQQEMALLTSYKQIIFNNMMLQSMYMNQMMIMQQSMFAARRRFAMQQQAMQNRQHGAANILGQTNLPSANQNSNLVPAKRDRVESNTEGSKKQKS